MGMHHVHLYKQPHFTWSRSLPFLRPYESDGMDELERLGLVATLTTYYLVSRRKATELDKVAWPSTCNALGAVSQTSRTTW